SASSTKRRTRRSARPSSCARSSRRQCAASASHRSRRISGVTSKRSATTILSSRQGRPAPDSASPATPSFSQTEASCRSDRGVLALQRGQRRFGGRTQVDFIYERRAKQDHSRRIAIGHLDEELAYFMGIITGDGNVTARNRIGLSSLEPEVIAAFKRTAHRFG